MIRTWRSRWSLQQGSFGVTMLVVGVAFGGWRAVMGPRDWMLLFNAGGSTWGRRSFPRPGLILASASAR